MEISTDISIGNLITLTVFVIGLVAQWYNFRNRINLLEQKFELTMTEHEKDMNGMGKKLGINVGKVEKLEKKMIEHIALGKLKNG